MTTILYGTAIAVVPDGDLVKPDGTPAKIKLVRLWSHKPGDIINSRCVRHTPGMKRRGERPIRTQYAVQADHSLKKI